MKARARRKAQVSQGGQSEACPPFTITVPRDGGHGARAPLPSLQILICDPQTHAAVKRVADRLRAGGAVEEEVGDPALGDAEAEPAAIFEPALIADCRHDGAVAGHAGDDAGSRSEGLHPSTVDVGFDA